ncbi:MAG: response regulator [Candidatus Obscuribacterales bacterium]|nr:response regulator [Candidatus Obscuribacterales bacterium]
MDRDEQLASLLPIFLTELEERVFEANQILLNLEKGIDQSKNVELIKALFRTAHSMKGGAMALGIKPIELICHSLEEIIGQIQKGADFNNELFRLLFEAMDAIDQTRLLIRDGKNLDNSPVAVLLPILKAKAKELQNSLSEPIHPVKPALNTESPVQPLNLENTDTYLKVSADKLDRLVATASELMAVTDRNTSHLDSLNQISRLVSQLKLIEPQIKRLNERFQYYEDVAYDDKYEHATLTDQLAKKLKGAVTRLTKDIESLDVLLSSDQRDLRRSVKNVIENVKELKMVPFSRACVGLDRVVRDMAKACGKQAHLQISGGEIELDRAVVDKLKDPLVHLVRNAIDHGIELADIRKQKNKSFEGVIKVSAAIKGSQVEITISDDGCGINQEKIAEKVAKLGLPIPADKHEAFDMIFQPGFSTASIVTELSGRGVGLDIVKNIVDSLHGSIVIDSTVGEGTSFSLYVPLTLATQRVLFVRTAGQLLAFIASSVEKLLLLAPDQFSKLEGKDVALLGEMPLPVITLSQVLELKGYERAAIVERNPALLIKHGNSRVIFLVDELLSEQEIVVKGLGKRIRKTKNVLGTTIMPGGELVLILNTPDLINAALKNGNKASLVDGLKEISPERKPRLLLVDDSITTRSLEKSILESAGYEVSVAADGVQAWRIIQEKGADLVVSDVEMPNMDGFQLTASIRASQRFSELPVVLVTALASDRDRAHGIEVGANAYIVKSEFDQTQLLTVLKQLI